MAYGSQCFEFSLLFSDGNASWQLPIGRQLYPRTAHIIGRMRLFLPDGSAPLASPQPGTKSQHHVYRDDRCKGVHRTFSAKGLKATIKYSSSDVRELVEDDEEGKHTHDSLANGLWTKGYLIASQTPSPTRVQRGAENSIRSYRYQKPMKQRAQRTYQAVLSDSDRVEVG
ncbi:hypothetical protein KCU81_g769, partial [Aureobasidium melanogenum]